LLLPFKVRLQDEVNWHGDTKFRRALRWPWPLQPSAWLLAWSSKSLAMDVGAMLGMGTTQCACCTRMLFHGAGKGGSPRMCILAMLGWTILALSLAVESYAGGSLMVMWVR